MKRDLFSAIYNFLVILVEQNFLKIISLCEFYLYLSELKVENLEFTLERQNVDLKSLTRLTYKLQDDLAHSGPVGGLKKVFKGSSSSSSSPDKTSSEKTNGLKEASLHEDG